MSRSVLQRAKALVAISRLLLAAALVARGGDPCEG